jgi:peptidoglycan-associated lipoprotein
MRSVRWGVATTIVVMTLAAVGCGGGKAKPTTPGSTPPVAQPPEVTRPDAPPQRVEEPTPMPTEPLAEDAIGGKSLDDLNRDSPLKPVFFGLDSADLDSDGQAIAQANAELLKRYPSWAITIEGHCDERGTAEYNLALGERRAVAVKTYLVSLGISPDRLRTVSYGKEFPFDPAHSEGAWSKNRRGHFVITAK